MYAFTNDKAFHKCHYHRTQRLTICVALALRILDFKMVRLDKSN